MVLDENVNRVYFESVSSSVKKFGRERVLYEGKKESMYLGTILLIFVSHTDLSSYGPLLLLLT